MCRFFFLLLSWASVLDVGFDVVWFGGTVPWLRLGNNLVLLTVSEAPLTTIRDYFLGDIVPLFRLGNNLVLLAVSEVPLTPVRDYFFVAGNAATNFRIFSFFCVFLSFCVFRRNPGV